MLVAAPLTLPGVDSSHLASTFHILHLRHLRHLAAAPLATSVAYSLRVAHLPSAPHSLQARKRKGDVSVGRYLADTVASVPFMSKEELEQMYTDSTQDALLVMYLANLTRAHIALADRLSTAALPLL